MADSLQEKPKAASGKTDDVQKFDVVVIGAGVTGRLALGTKGLAQGPGLRRRPIR